MKFDIVIDIDKAKNIWDLLSPKQKIDDEWDFRYVFYKDLNIPIHFIVGYVNNTPVGLLPLQQNTLKGLMPPYYPKDGKEFLEFFGGDDTDDNDIFINSTYESEKLKFLE